MKNILPFMMIVTFITFSACKENAEGKGGFQIAAKAPPAYTLVDIKRSGVSSTVKLPAQLAAYQEVSIFPKVNAYVKTINVDIGDKVKAGQVLMKLEAPELQQAVEQAKEKYARARAELSIDREHYQRLQVAAATPGAVSALDLSTVRSRTESDSALANAEKSNWQMQSELQTYLTVIAPFEGVITERNVSPGVLVNAIAKDRPMLELKEIAKLRLRVEVPEALASTLDAGDTISFYTSATPGRRMAGKISRKSMNVDPRYRSERVEIDVKNTDGLLSAGMFADVLVYSKGNQTAWRVPEKAIITNTERKFIWIVQNGRAHPIDVVTGNVSGGFAEVFASMNPGNRVISNPDDQLSEGQLIK